VAKNERGLPSTFNLDIPEPVREAPVQLGDYLDEVDTPVVRPAPRPVPRTTVENRAHESRPGEHRPATPRPETESSALPLPRPNEAESAPHKPLPVPKGKRKTPKPPPRKQINATPETLRMIEDLIDHVQTYSVQKDAKASEVFHALVLALYEAREHLDLSDIPPRGRWGTPTAQAFPVALKSAFHDAITLLAKRGRR
jgi:hypothetical protein